MIDNPFKELTLEQFIERVAAVRTSLEARSALKARINEGDGLSVAWRNDLRLYAAVLAYTDPTNPIHAAGLRKTWNACKVAVDIGHKIA